MKPREPKPSPYRQHRNREMTGYLTSDVVSGAGKYHPDIRILYDPDSPRTIFIQQFDVPAEQRSEANEEDTVALTVRQTRDLVARLNHILQLAEGQ